MLRPPPRSPLFPSTTLFRSAEELVEGRARADARRQVHHGVHALERGLDRGEVGDVGLVAGNPVDGAPGSEEHTSELQSHHDLVCRLLLEKKKKKKKKK